MLGYQQPPPPLPGSLQQSFFISHFKTANITLKSSTKTYDSKPQCSTTAKSRMSSCRHWTKHLEGAAAAAKNLSSAEGQDQRVAGRHGGGAKELSTGVGTEGRLLQRYAGRHWQQGGCTGRASTGAGGPEKQKQRRRLPAARCLRCRHRARRATPWAAAAPPGLAPAWR
jgi:hypothetical protein